MTWATRRRPPSQACNPEAGNAPFNLHARTCRRTVVVGGDVATGTFSARRRPASGPTTSTGDGRRPPPPPVPLVRQRQLRRCPPQPSSRPWAAGPTRGTRPSVYGDDPWTWRRQGARRSDRFGDVTTLLTFNGTGANVLALLTLLGPADAVVCADWEHSST